MPLEYKLAREIKLREVHDGLCRAVSSDYRRKGSWYSSRSLANCDAPPVVS